MNVKEGSAYLQIPGQLADVIATRNQRGDDAQSLTAPQSREHAQELIAAQFQVRSLQSSKCANRSTHVKNLLQVWLCCQWLLGRCGGYSEEPPHTATRKSGVAIMFRSSLGQNPLQLV